MKPCKDCAIWRETVAILIRMLPARERAIVYEKLVAEKKAKGCARIAMIPSVWKQLTATEQRTVKGLANKRLLRKATK